MRLVMITMFAVTSKLVDLAIAKPVPNMRAGGIAIPLTRHPSFLDSNESIDLNAITSHGISVREKILSGLDNYETNTGTMHPFAVNRSESGLGTRGNGVPLTTRRPDLWMCEISIGTPPKTLKVHIDTGAADTWVLQTGCAGVPGDRDLWDPYSSKSVQNQGLSFQFKYGDGTIVQGDRYADIVTIAGFTANSQTVGSATSYTSPIMDNGHADGLLGLAFPSVGAFHAYPLFSSLVRQNKLDNPTVSFKFSSPGAEMYVGGTNSMLYNGHITYTPVTNAGYWQVSMDEVRINGDKILESIPVIFDTGANHIFGDWNHVSGLYRRLGGTLKELEGFGYYSLPCNSFPTVSLTFGGTTFEIPLESMILAPTEEGSPNCFGAIVAMRLSTTPYWTIGMAFLKGVYTVFDYGNPSPRVGFAELA